MKTDQFGRPLNITQDSGDIEFMNSSDDHEKNIAGDDYKQDQNTYEFNEESFNKQFETNEENSTDNQHLDESNTEIDSNIFEKVKTPDEFDSSNLPAPKIYREKIDKMYKAMEMQNLQILGLSKLVEKLNENIDELKFKENKNTNNNSNYDEREKNKEENKEQTKIVLTPLGGIIFVLTFIIILFYFLTNFLNINIFSFF